MTPDHQSTTPGTPARPHPAREYAPLLHARLAADTPEDAMQRTVDALWDAFHAHAVSWVGFYTLAPDSSALLLGPRRDKPACSPIGFHGVCGRAFREQRPVIVRDVATLGASYIACDPRDRSEVVVPLFTLRGRCYAVLDVDSHQTDAFDEHDAEGLLQVVSAAGLSQPERATPRFDPRPIII